MDVEYISLRGYIRNTPSDTEVHAEYQLRADRSTDQWKRIHRTMQNLMTKELGGKTEVLLGLDLPLAVGELKQGSNPHIGTIA